MKSSIIEWLERAWAGMSALAPYLALFLLPGGSLLVFVLVVSRHGRAPAAYSGEDDRLIRQNVTGDSGEFALRVFSTLIGHDQSRFRAFPGRDRNRIRHRFCDSAALAV